MVKGIMASAAGVDITPEPGCWLDGNIRDRTADSVHDPLFARCLVMESDGVKIVFITLDICAIKEEDVNLIRSEISGCTGINSRNVIIACSHTHSGPAAFGFFNPDEPDYINELRKKTVNLVKEASSSMENAFITAGKGKEGTISEYRRLLTKDGKIVMNWDTFDEEDIAGPAGEPDPEVGVLKIVRTDGKTMAILYNHAGHPNVLAGESLCISADYPGYASKVIENKLDCIALFTNGAQGSVDIPAFKERDFSGIVNKGTVLAEEVIRIALDCCVLKMPFLAVMQKQLAIPKYRIEDGLAEWARRVLQDAEIAGKRRKPVQDGITDEIYAEQVLWLAGKKEETFAFEITGVAVDDILLLTIPGELFTEIGLEIKKKSPFSHTYIIGLANGYQGYIPSEEAFRQGGYGSHPGMTVRFFRKADGMIIDACSEVACALHELRELRKQGLHSPVDKAVRRLV